MNEHRSTSAARADKRRLSLLASAKVAPPRKAQAASELGLGLVLSGKRLVLWCRQADL